MNDRVLTTYVMGCGQKLIKRLLIKWPIIYIIINSKYGLTKSKQSKEGV